MLFYRLILVLFYLLIFNRFNSVLYRRKDKECESLFGYRIMVFNGDILT